MSLILERVEVMKRKNNKLFVRIVAVIMAVLLAVGAFVSIFSILFQ